MKKLISIVITLLFFSGYNYAQHTLNGSTDLSGSGVQIVKINASTYDYGTYAIGRETVSNDVKIYRTYFELSLGLIPTNATITQAYVSYSNGINGYTLKLTQLATVSPTDKQANWAAIGNGSSLHTGLAYNGSSFYSTPIKNAIQNQLSNRILYIGTLSESEATNGSNSSMSLSIHVTYTYPAASLTVQARNDLEGGDGGNIGAAIYPTAASSHGSPYTIPNVYETDRLNLAAYDNQTVGSYTWIFNDSEAPSNTSEWKKNLFGNESHISYSASTTTQQLTTSDNGASFVAYLKKICNLEFSSPGGYVYVNNISYASPKTSQVVAQNSVTASGQWYYSNYIEYTFDYWDNNPNSDTITATAHNTYTAVYIGRPTNTGEYASAGADVGDPIVVTWTDNPNTAVNQFQIWRRVKHNGVTGDPVLLTTVGRGVQSYTDYDYVATDGYTDDLCQYDVRAYYSTEGTYSDPNYVTAFGRMEAEIDNDLSEKNTRSLVTPTEYSITNYPNPFNPTTTINYQLPENGFVTIKVYDLLGKEVATLVNESKSAGYHRINFDAGKLTSGVYVYTITANNFVQSKKMLLMK